MEGWQLAVQAILLVLEADATLQWSEGEVMSEDVFLELLDINGILCWKLKEETELIESLYRILLG